MIQNLVLHVGVAIKCLAWHVGDAIWWHCTCVWL